MYELTRLVPEPRGCVDASDPGFHDGPRRRHAHHLDAITVPVTQQMALIAETELTVMTEQMVMTEQGAKMNADADDCDDG